MSDSVPVSEMSDQARAERLAELKARRRARLRKAGMRSGIGLLVLLLLLVLGVYWLLQTVAGRDVLMAQIVARLPAGSSLTWSKIDGPLAGPLTLHDLDFQYDGLRFTAAEAHLDPDIRPLLGRTLRLDALRLRDAHLDMGPADEEPFQLPTWPDVLPALDMPLSIQADTITVDNLKVSRQGEPLVTVFKVRGGVTLADGELEAKALKVNTDRADLLLQGHYRPRNGYQIDLVVRALVPVPDGETMRLGLAVRGDLDRMELALAGHAPQPVHAMAILTGRKDPTWRAYASGDRLQVGDWLPGAQPGAPLSLSFTGRGRGDQAQVQGRIQQGDKDVVLVPSSFVLDDQVLHLQPLVLQAYGGTIGARGTADFRIPGAPRFTLSMSLQGLNWTPAQEGKTPAVPVYLEQGLLGISGSSTGWAAYGTVRASRDAQQADLLLDVRGSDRGAHIEKLVATTPGGEARAEGKVGWSPTMAWDAQVELKAFDPGYFLPGWDGRLSGVVRSTGNQIAPAAGQTTAGPLTAEVDIPRLHGQLRGRPLDGRFSGQWHEDRGSGDLDLRVGSSQVTAEGQVGKVLDVSARLAPLHLDDLLPGAGGVLTGDLALKGPAASPDIRVSLQGSGLRYDEYRADQLQLSGHLPWRGGAGELALQASGVQAGVVLDQLQLKGQGNLQRLQLSGTTRNALAALALGGQVGQTRRGWAGHLETLRIDPAKGADWQLRAPASFQLNGNNLVLEHSCLGASTGGALCVSANWPARGITFNGDALPLSLVQPWIPPNEGRTTYLRGDLVLDGHLRPHGNGVQGQIKVVSAEGGVRLGDSGRERATIPDEEGNRQRGELISYDNFNATVDLTPQSINAYAGIGFKGNGFVDARVSTGWSPNAPLVGDIYLNMARLYWLELFSADLVRPTGLLEGHVSLRGTRSTPLIGGEATLSNFAGELPALGLTLSDGRGQLVAQPDGTARITASTKTGGQGTLQVAGGLSLFGQAQPLQLKITGKNVLVANTPEVRAVADPDLDFTLDATAMRLTGTVHVPEADLDLERLERGTSISDDVVVVDPYYDDDGGSTSPLAMDLTVSLGNKVSMNGFGLKGTLGGQLRVQAVPGREMTGNGKLEIGGRYRAYGQDLTITEGQLLWNNNPVSDPRIAINAKREVGAVTAGIKVSGRAMQPRVDVWANPSTSQSEALSYLLLGRSLSMASSDQADQVNAAAAALSAGSGLLAGQIGAKLGFDDAGVSQSRALGGSVLGVGKYITPKLYVGYGVSLIGSGSVLTLKYLLRKGFDIEVESSTVENRGSVNWRKEK